MRICVVNFAKGSWYPKGQKRIKDSFLRNGYQGDFLFYTNEQQLNCPTHQQIPYAFKAYALKKTFDKGYDVVLWVDASITLLQSFSKVLDHIVKYDYMLLLNGWSSGEWCSDAALKTLGITREESFTYPHIMACVMGFNTHDETNIKFLDEYLARAKDGITFRGDWKNDKQQVSKDKRVLGHRHDQTAASIIAWRLGMRHFAEYLLSYNPDLSKHQNTILFLNRGGH